MEKGKKIVLRVLLVLAILVSIGMGVLTFAVMSHIQVDEDMTRLSAIVMVAGTFLGLLNVWDRVVADIPKDQSHKNT